MLILIPLLVVVVAVAIAGAYYLRHAYSGAAAQHQPLFAKPVAQAAVGLLAVIAVVLVVLIVITATAKGTNDKTNSLLGGNSGTTQQP